MHARALHAGERLRHETGVDALALRGLLHHEPDGHHGVGHRERIGVAEVDLVLARRVLVLGVLDGDAHLLEREDTALTEVTRHVGGGELEVRARVEGHGRVRRIGVGEVEVLDLRGGEEGESLLAGAVEVPAQHVPGASLEGSPVEVEDVAEDPGDGCLVGVPGKDLERLGIGSGQHIALLDPGESVDGRSVEGHTLLEGVLELGRRDGEGLGRSQDIGEPQLHEPHGAFFHRPEHVFLLAPHVTSAVGHATSSRHALWGRVGPCSPVSQAPEGSVDEFIRRLQTGNAREIRPWNAGARRSAKLGLRGGG